MLHVGSAGGKGAILKGAILIFWMEKVQFFQIAPFKGAIIYYGRHGNKSCFFYKKKTNPKIHTEEPRFALQTCQGHRLHRIL